METEQVELLSNVGCCSSNRSGLPSCATMCLLCLSVCVCVRRHCARSLLMPSSVLRQHGVSQSLPDAASRDREHTMLAACEVRNLCPEVPVVMA